MNNLIYILCGLYLFATVLSYFHFPRWWFRIWDVVQPYQFALGIILLFLLVFGIPGWPALKGITLATTLACTAFHLWIVFPYSPFYPRESKNFSGEKDLSLLSINVLETNDKVDAFLKIVKDLDPDLLLVLEYSEIWHGHREKFEEFYPYRLSDPSDEGFGIAFFSRLPLENEEIRYRCDPNVPSVYSEILLPRGGRATFIGVHPTPPVPWISGSTPEKDQEVLLWAEEIGQMQNGVIMAGDFNDVSWSDLMKEFRKSSKLKDPRVGRGFYFTFHAKSPILNIPIDHIFLSDHWNLIHLSTVKLEGSDHLGLYTEIKLNTH